MRNATQKEIDNFIEYRANHVALVQRIGSVVFGIDISDHDKDKIEADGEELNLFSLRNSMLNGTYHPHKADRAKLKRLVGKHVKSQKHHPEYWDDSITARNFDDENPPQVNAHKMPKRYLLEMVCDWCAVALKLNKPLFNWYNKTCIGENARFLFTDNQKEYIIECISRVASKIKEENLHYPKIEYTAELDSPKIDFGKKLTESKEDMIYSKESDNIYEKILHKNNKWVVTDHTGKKNLGTYDTKEEAEKRLKQVEYFKHINESQTYSDDFKRWFGNSVVKDNNGNPLVLYHGTPSTTPDITEFNSSRASNNSGEDTLIYATDSKEMAEVFSMDSKEGKSNLTRTLTGEKGKVYPLYMRLEHPMDFRNLEDKDIDVLVEAYLEYKKDLGEDKDLKEIENKYREEIKQDSKFGVDFVKSKHLRLLVHPRYIHIFKEHGYDGIICPMEEFRGVKGALEYAVISPNQIKSIDNQGTFSLQSSNIYEKVITSFGGKVPISSKDKDQIQKFCKKAVEDGMKPTKYTEEEMGGMANSSNFSSSSIASNTPENPIKVTNLGEEKLEEAYVVCSLDGQVVDGTYTTDLAKAKTMRQELADEYHTFFKLMTVQDKEEPMEEALEKKKTCVFTFGRYQPPTKGHLKVWEKVADTEGDAHYIYTSHTKDKKRNPLDYNTKIGLIKSALKEHNINAEVIDSEAKTIIDVVVDIASKGYNNLIFVGGSDRLDDMVSLIRKYNDKPNAEGNSYHFDSIEGVSAGERDPDSDNVEGISGTKLRQMAIDGDFEGFKNNLAFSDESTIKEVMKLIQNI